MPRRRRYPSDLTTAQWRHIAGLLPPPRLGGRPEKHSRRAIVHAVLYVVRTGCSWRQLPADFPPWQTVYWYFVRWEQEKVTPRILDHLREQVRISQGRNPRQRSTHPWPGRRQSIDVRHSVGLSSQASIPAHMRDRMTSAATATQPHADARTGTPAPRTTSFGAHALNFHP
ncbi:transposase [Micromonospora radicis]|uniref:transposase n=1 Tax=Micromonospora radicis TaxID=1894971 RepID=UPI001314B66E